MRAHIHINAKMRQEIAERSYQAASDAAHDIATRAQYLWALACLQIGLSPRTVNRIIDALPMVTEKYKEFKNEQLGDIFAHYTLKESGVNLPETEHKQ